MRITTRKHPAKKAKDITIASGGITAMEGGVGGLVLALEADGKMVTVHIRAIELIAVKPYFERALASVGEGDRPTFGAARETAPHQRGYARRPYRDD